MGARTIDHLADNIAAATWSLSDAEIALLDKVSAIPLRYPYYMHREHTGGRNPSAPLLPPLPSK